MVQAGELRNLFTIERPNDASGSPQHVAQGTVWGSLSGLTGIESPAIQANADHRIGLRYRADLTTRDRLRLGTRVFELVSPPIDPDGRRRELELLVREQV